MSKRQVSLVVSLALVLVLTALAGCGGPAPTPAPTQPPAVPTKAPAAEPTKAPAAPTAAPTAVPTAAPTKAAAPSFPTRPVTLVATHGAGSGIDIAARILVPYLQKYLGQPVVVENKEGASGRTARAEVFKAKPDGYTLLVTGYPSTQLGELVYDGAYKTAEFTHIYNFLGGGDYAVVYVDKNSSYKTLKDLIDASKQKALKVAIPGMGSSAHLFAVYLRQKAGLVSTVIQYPAAQEILAVTSGDVPCATDTASGVVGQDKIRVLAVASDHGRSPMFPDVPTTKELGFNGLEVPYRVGVVAPPGVPADIQKILADAMAKAVADPGFLADMKKAQLFPEPMDPVAFKQANVDLLTSLQSVVADVKKDMQ